MLHRRDRRGLSRSRRAAYVLTGLMAGLLAGCAAPATISSSYPDPGRPTPVVVVLGEVESLDGCQARLRVTEAVYGDAPQVVEFHTGPCYVRNSSGCFRTAYDLDLAGWILPSDRLLAVLAPGESGDRASVLRLLYARWFRGPLDDLSQEILRQTGADLSAAEQACREDRNLPILDLYSLVERTWVPEPLPLGELASDVRDFYRNRRHWLAPDSAPWHRKGRWKPDP